MSTSDLIFIIGRQRSGTTVFRDLLKRNGALDCDEIFHGTLNNEYRFYGYLADRVTEDRSLVHPERHPQIFREYIDWMRSRAEGRPLAMDVKYFALNLIPNRDDVDGTHPFIINYMRNEKAHIVHIVRRNKLRILVSERLASLTGRWSVGRPEHMVSDKPKIVIEPNVALQFIERVIEQDRRVRAMIARTPDYKQIFYDEMFDSNGMFAEQVQSLAADVMEGDGQYAKPGNMKMNPEPISALVENYQELAAALSSSEHAWMLHDDG